MSALWTTPPGQNHAVNALTWSPDGRRVAASLMTPCLPGTCQASLLLIDTQTGATTTIAKAANLLGKVRFAPDGRTISFTVANFTTGAHLHVLALP